MAKAITTHNYPALRKHTFGLIIGLLIQYLLGMVTNLFVKFPDDETPKQSWQFAWTQLPLALHIIIGFLILFGSLVLLIRAVRTGDQKWIIASSVSFVFIFLSAFEGSSFIPIHQEVYSFIMSIGFAISLISYFWVFYTTKT